jgi:hypothetical protein
MRYLVTLQYQVITLLSSRPCIVLLFTIAWHCDNLCHVITSISVVITTQPTQLTVIQAQHRYCNKMPIILQPHVGFSQVNPDKPIRTLPHPAIRKMCL